MQVTGADLRFGGAKAKDDIADEDQANAVKEKATKARRDGGSQSGPKPERG